MARSDKTLEDILNIIFYDKPSTQDEIAEKLKISRRYVTQLLKPLIEEDIVKRAYVIDLNKYGFSFIDLLYIFSKCFSLLSHKTISSQIW